MAEKTFEDIESEDYSLETSVPTDLTMSPDHSDHESRNKKRHFAKQLIERKQMQHDIQLLKIEVSQKNFALESLRAEQLQTVEELEEKLQDATHQKQILQVSKQNQFSVFYIYFDVTQFTKTQSLLVINVRKIYLNLSNINI